MRGVLVFFYIYFSLSHPLPHSFVRVSHSPSPQCINRHHLAVQGLQGAAEAGGDEEWPRLVEAQRRPDGGGLGVIRRD